MLRPLARWVLRLAFRDPFDAVEPILFLAASRAIEAESGLYLHRMTRKPVDPRASAPDSGSQLWAQSEQLRERLMASAGDGSYRDPDSTTYGPTLMAARTAGVLEHAARQRRPEQGRGCATRKPLSSGHSLLAPVAALAKRVRSEW